MANFWTKKNVEKMTDEKIRIWLKDVVKNLDKANELGVELPACSKALRLLTKEMKVRGMI